MMKVFADTLDAIRYNVNILLHGSVCKTSFTVHHWSIPNSQSCLWATIQVQPEIMCVLFNMVLFFCFFLLYIGVKLWKEAASPDADFLGLQHREISDLREKEGQTGLQPKAKGDRSREIEGDNERSWRKPTDTGKRWKENGSEGTIDNNKEGQRQRQRKRTLMEQERENGVRWAKETKDVDFAFNHLAYFQI